MAEDTRSGEAVPELLERDSELAELGRLLDAAAGGEGGCIVVEGEAGIGKSALLARAGAAAGERGMRVLRARGGELERDHPFGVVRQLFEPELARADAEARTRLLSGAAAIAAPLVGADGEEPGPAEPSAALHGLYWLAANAAAESPLALIVDDAHWADRPSVRWLIYLTRRLEGAAVAVVCSARIAEAGAPGELLARLRAEHHARAIEPGRLSAGAVADLVREALGERGDGAVAAACHEVTGGNPYLVAELLEALALEEIAPGEEAARVREIGPAAVSQGVLVRLAALAPEAIAVAEAAAVLGSGAGMREVAALARLDPAGAAEVADSLGAARVLAAGTGVEFRHPLVRNAIYSNLGERRRAEAHGRAARVLADLGAAPERVAAHLMEATPGGDEWVVERLESASSVALARGAVETACSLLRRALAEPPPPASRAAVLHALGSAEALAFDPGAVEHLAEALERAGEPAERAPIAMELGVVLTAIGEPARGIELLRAAREELGADGGELALQVEAAIVSVAVNGVSTFSLVDERILKKGAELEGRTLGERSLLAALAIHRAISAAPRDEVARLAQRALARGPLIAEGAPHSILHDHLGCVALIASDHLELGAAATERFLDAARTRGSLVGHQSGVWLRALIGQRLGTLEAALEDARHATELAEEVDGLVTAQSARGVLVGVLVDLGRLDQAQAAFDQAGFGPADFEGDDTGALWLLRHRAVLHAAQGRLEAALADQMEVGRRCEQAARVARISPALFPWRSEAALALLGLGRDAEAVDLAAEEVDVAREMGAPRPLGLALRAEGLARGGERGLEVLGEAVAVLRPGQARLACALALVDLGAAIRRAGRKSAARDPLREGLELAHRCGAAGLEERALVELRAAGARPRRPVTSGIDALTVSEVRVARMAADGMSNPQIAQALFVTRKTVERHLANAYAKLGIAGRGELAATLADTSPPS